MYDENKEAKKKKQRIPVLAVPQEQWSSHHFFAAEPSTLVYFGGIP